MKEHEIHLTRVFNILKAHQYVVRRDKYMLAAKKIEYLGHFIAAEGVSMNPRKVQVVQEWPVQTIEGILGSHRILP